MSPDRCLLAVHAHPDDESEFAAGTAARYHDEGVRIVLVCCTDGGQGKVRNPEVGTVGVRAEDVVEVRRRELEAGAAIIGFDRVVRLDFPDSGSVGLDDSERPPGCFARLPLDEVVAPVVEVMRQERPQVVITYADDQRAYPHPDHLRAHEVAVAAFDALSSSSVDGASGDGASGDGASGDGADVWRPDRLFYTVTSRERRLMINAAYAAMHLPPPFSVEVGFQGRGDPSDAPARSRVTTEIEVADYVAVWVEGMRAHACQLNPDLDRTLGIPPERAAELFGSEEFILARSTGPALEGAGDLFAGLQLS